ncbi:ABC transporter permease subunit [Paenibacillus donghaensis]|uniref:ABC transporter permease n=1 Tax=Paenibacillus TaxID=44249 RepID=UPI001883F828|nr:ABC transporter permease [Paenibacillus donghaensis]MBE9914776.1 ABC transporter permease subunit [Paenibacillus donghaensis]
MYSLKANMLNEIEKIWRRRKTKVFLLLTLLIPVICTMLLSLLRNKTSVIWGLGGDLPMLMLSLFTFFLLPMMLSITAVDSFSGEVAARTIKLVLVRPITRAKAFAAKVLAIMVYAWVYLSVLWIVSSVSGWAIAGEGITGGLADSLKAYTAAFLPMAAIGLLSVFIAQCFRTGSGALTTIIFVYATGKLLPFIFPKVSGWSVFSYSNWHVLWTGSGASVGKLFNTFLFLLAYIIMSYTAGLMLFERKQL